MLLDILFKMLDDLYTKEVFILDCCRSFFV